MSGRNTHVRRIAATAAVLALTAATLITVSASPAQAHSRSSAIYYGCGPGYFKVSDGVREIKDPRVGQEVWAEVVLAYNSSNSHNCVVTYKPHGSTAHGVPTALSASIRVQYSSEGWVTNSCSSCSHWESVTRWARDRCVMYKGYVENQYGVRASAGRYSWGNCD